MAEREPYWTSSISEITPETVFVRGYRLEDLIGTSFTASVFLLIKGRLPSPQEAAVLDAILTGVLDYGLEKTGTAAARYVVSSNPSMQAALATAILAAGDYALAPENSARFITDTHAAWVAAGRPDMKAFAEQIVADARRAKLRIPGFGHAVFKKKDPRSEILRSIAVDNQLWGEPAQLYEAVHQSFIQLPGREDFPINDVGMLAAISVAVGFTPQEATALAVLGTLPGIVAHVSEEYATGKIGRVIPAADVAYDVPRRDYAEDLSAAGWAADDGI
ncbi:citryl-CoA lyase [Nocardioides sp. KIGAM211]|uniref:citrate synthase (unknown stereospecificity) n=1 Tax=Nocardioides luti TaxID=2761101 RepID=A0A7X0RG46_9ACTN|nr:citryl-CoA lyase [Nocardioides luti]MBB6627587.1 citryl-CoA lyase [Nocardioides luti]